MNNESGTEPKREDHSNEVEATREAFREASHLYRYFLVWRERLLAGFFAIEGGLFIGVLPWTYKQCPKRTHFVFLAAFAISVVVYFLEKRNRALYQSAKNASLELEKKLLPPGLLGAYGHLQKNDKSIGESEWENDKNRPYWYRATHFYKYHSWTISKFLELSMVFFFSVFLITLMNNGRLGDFLSFISICFSLIVFFIVICDCIGPSLLFKDVVNNTEQKKWRHSIGLQLIIIGFLLLSVLLALISSRISALP